MFRILDKKCSRLSTTEAITVPLTDYTSEMPQLILDLKESRAVDWNSVTLIADDSVGQYSVFKTMCNYEWLISCTLSCDLHYYYISV